MAVPSRADGLEPERGAPATLVPVAVPPRSRARDLRAIVVVWRRELLRFASHRMRIFTALLQPTLYIFALGTGPPALTGSSALTRPTFIYPGAPAMAVMCTAVFSAASIVWDRELGSLRE